MSKRKEVAIVLYVVDLLLGSNHLAKFEGVERKLNQMFKMKDMGEPRDILVMKINRFLNELTWSLTFIKMEYRDTQNG